MPWNNEPPIWMKKGIKLLSSTHAQLKATAMSISPSNHPRRKTIPSVRVSRAPTFQWSQPSRTISQHSCDAQVSVYTFEACLSAAIQQLLGETALFGVSFVSFGAALCSEAMSSFLITNAPITLVHVRGWTPFPPHLPNKWGADSFFFNAIQ